MADTAEIIQFPERRDDAQSPGPESPGRSPQVEDGFVRIANELHQALAQSRMTGNERAIVDAVIRLTYGYQRKEARITGHTFANWTGMDSSDCGSIVTELVRRRILIRAGSRSPISLNKDYSQWEKPRGAQRRVKKKAGESGDNRPTGERGGELPHSGENRPTESGDNRPTYKDRKDTNPLTTFGGGASDENPPDLELTPPAEPSAPKAKGSPKPKPTKLDLTNLPDGVSAEAAQAFIDHRKALKKPLTQRALTLALGEAVKASRAIPGMTPDQAIDEAILAGWQGVKAQWLINRQGGGGAQPKARQDGRKGFAQPQPAGTYTPTDMDNLPAWMRD